jgi:hypothetical protein
MTAVAADAVLAEATDDTVYFGLVELDLLATYAGVPFPFPLRVPSCGRIAGEREVLLATAGQTLLVRGLVDETGPVGVAAELVTALRQYRGTVDLVLAGADGATGVVAMIYRSRALLCIQPLNDDPAGTVGIRRVADTAVADGLLRMVPDLAAPITVPITLPAPAVDAAQRLVQDASSAMDYEQQVRDLVRDHGVDPAVLDQLAGLLAPLSGRGQLGATRRASPNTRAGAELSWLDGPRGRVRVSTADGWVSVNPLQRAQLRSAFEELATIARRPR